MGVVILLLKMTFFYCNINHIINKTICPTVSAIRYDVGGQHTCLSRRIPGFESPYRKLFFGVKLFYANYCIGLHSYFSILPVFRLVKSNVAIVVGPQVFKLHQSWLINTLSFIFFSVKHAESLQGMLVGRPPLPWPNVKIVKKYIVELKRLQ